MAPFPNFHGKHDEESLISPARYIEHLRESGRFPTVPLPQSVVLCFQTRLVKHIEASRRVSRCDGFLSEMMLLEETAGRVGVISGMVGAPAAVVRMEHLIACGVRRFISVGTAGTLQPDIEIGDLVVCERAVRDEGTSHHYVAPAEFAHPSRALTERLVGAIERSGLTFRRGTSWTVDAPYRETIAEARHYQAAGVATVEMEASALFAVAAFRSVEVASVFTITDSLAGQKWNPEFRHPRATAGLEALAAAAISALSD